MVKCSLCKESFASVNTFKVHLKVVHHETVFFRYVCGEDCCSRNFDSWRCYRQHLIKFHKCPTDEHFIQPSLKHSDSDRLVNETVEVPVFVDNPNHIEPAITASEFRASLEKSAEILVAKLYQKPSVPRNYVQSVMDDFDSFIGSGFVDLLQKKVVQLLSSSETTQTSIDEVNEMFDAFKDPFKDLSSDYKRMVRFQKSNFYVPPETYIISDNRMKVFRTKNGPITKQVKTTGQYVPLRPTLKNLFELPGALSETLDYMNSLKHSVNHVSNFIQCQLWQDKISKYSESDIVIPLNFYYDEFESNSALGPHSEKLGAGYIQIPVLPPSCQSKIENILLAVLIDADDRKTDEVGRTSYNKEVFSPLIRELNLLEKDGILCQTELGEKRVYFMLALVIGDNLGVHGINGFAEGFTCNFPCRICKAPKELTWSMTKEDSALFRNCENYADDVKVGNLSVNGVKEECVFNAVKSFHVTENRAVDAMHDGAEGMCHYVLIPVLKHCIDAGYFTIDVLNARMSLFDFGPCDSSNKPPCISDEFYLKSKLKFTAAEMTSFVRLLGVFVGDLVPEMDEYWHCFKLLRQIMQIVQSKELPADMSEELSVLVHEHHSLYLKLEHRNLPPKFHHFVHYGSILASSGPFAHYSSIRGESKHRQLKNYTNAITSRKNLPLSAAIKHQLILSYRFATKSPLVPQLSCGPSEVFDVQEHPYFFDFRSSLPDSLKSNSNCERANWVDFKGTRYEPDMVLVVGANEETHYIFGKIVDVFILEGEPLFLCNVLNNIGFCEHIGGFEVTKCKSYRLVHHVNLFNPFPLYDFLTCKGDRFVVLKYYI